MPHLAGLPDRAELLSLVELQGLVELLLPAHLADQVGLVDLGPVLSLGSKPAIFEASTITGPLARSIARIGNFIELVLIYCLFFLLIYLALTVSTRLAVHQSILQLNGLSNALQMMVGYGMRPHVTGFFFCISSESKLFSCRYDHRHTGVYGRLWYGNSKQGAWCSCFSLKGAHVLTAGPRI